MGVIEHSWCAAYREQSRPRANRTCSICTISNRVLHARCAASEPRAAAFAHRVFREASLELERSWLPRFSQVLATSESDAAARAAIAPAADVRVYPNAIPARPMPG